MGFPERFKSMRFYIPRAALRLAAQVGVFVLCALCCELCGVCPRAHSHGVQGVEE